MLAALMSSLASVFNSTSTIFTMDIWRRIDSDASQERLVLVGKVATAAMTVMGILWIPLIKSLQGGLYVYTHKIMAYLAPPITVVFVMGIGWKRGNTEGATAALAYGFFVGLARLFGEINIARSPDNSAIVQAFFHSNFLHFAMVFGYSCAAVMAWVSLKYPPPVVDPLFFPPSSDAAVEGEEMSQMGHAGQEGGGKDGDEGHGGGSSAGGEGGGSGEGSLEAGEGDAVVLLAAVEGGKGNEHVEAGEEDENRQAHVWWTGGLILALLCMYWWYR